jgi:hypothetical protein
VNDAFSIDDDPDVHRVLPPSFDDVAGLELVGRATVDLTMALEGPSSTPASAYGVLFERGRRPCG